MREKIHTIQTVSKNVFYCFSMIVLMVTMMFLLSFYIGKTIAHAETKTGTVGIVCTVTEEGLSAYKEAHPNDGNGVYVYIKSLNDDTVYRYPLDQSNGYEGRYEIPYGNYQIIKNPSGGSVNVICEDVFAVSDDTPDASISCSIVNDATVSASEEKSESEVTASPVETGEPEAEEETEATSTRKFSAQNIFTIIVLAICAILWIYNRFFKFRR